MRIIFLLLFLTVGLFMTGCEPEVSKPVEIIPDLTTATAGNDGLSLRINLDTTTFVSGQQFTVKIGAANLSDKPLVINAGYAAPYIISIQQKTAKGWETVNSYPQVTRGLMRAWTLQAGKNVDFQSILIAEPSWPSHEPLRLEVKLSGRNDVAPFVTIMVITDESQK